MKKIFVLVASLFLCTLFANAQNNVIDNEFVAGYLLKAGIIYEEMGKPMEALKQYEIIKEQYGNTYEGREINKYITRIKVAE